MAQNFRFDDTLHALEMKAPALRRWLQFGLIGKTAKGKREGWSLEFTCHDVATLALVKAMVEYGMPVAAAHALAVRLMREQGPWSDDAPAETYWNVFAPDRQVLIERIEGKGGRPAWRITTFDSGDEAFGAFLTLFPRRLIRAVLERAIEAAEVREEKRSA